MSGKGRVVVNADGPVEEIDLGHETISVEGKLVIARTADVRYRVVRPTRSLVSYWLSGEEYLRQYRGPGKVLLVSTPYAKRPDPNEMTYGTPQRDPAPREENVQMAAAGANVADAVQSAAEDAVDETFQRG